MCVCVCTLHFYYHKQDTGKVEPVSVNVGDKVLVPEYGGTKLSLDEKVY